ncbi:MAG: hypothetical protein M1343_05505 [Chloroflexi bacterium]|nr:hypothetical protein [Chloroflexota bacterium]
MQTQQAVIEWLHAVCELGHKFDFATIDQYGLLIGRSPKNEFALEDTFADPFFEEVERLVDQILGEWRTLKGGTSGFFHRVLGYACDPAPSGLRYFFTGAAWCPVCGSRAKDYDAYSPPRTELLDIPLVTHREWNNLTPQEKRSKIVQALRETGCLPEGV